jgi:hypothetical protein
LRVPRGKRKAAFAVDQYVISDDDIAATLNPVYEDVRPEAAAVAAAIRLEQDLGHQDAAAPVVHAPNQQKNSEDDFGDRPWHGQPECVPALSQCPGTAREPMVGNGQKLSNTRLSYVCHLT